MNHGVIILFFFPVLFLNHRAPRFKGFQQQDSQELLHYLLDAVRTEETKVRFLNVFQIFSLRKAHLLGASGSCL
jgi:uncharacterized UBP type Zn finger protein